MLKKNNFIFCFFISCYFIHSQDISGTIMDEITKEPLIGVTVYIDGTTIGVIADLSGNFHLELKKNINAALIVSHIGYETKAFQTEEFKAPKNIYLVEKRNKLDEIILPHDGWSREKKLRIFKSEFLGKTISTKYCKILNSKDISLIYNSSSNTLHAYSDKPIIITNRYLNYKILYSLVDFEIQFKNNMNGLRFSHLVYYAGTSYFSNLNLKNKKKQISNRKNTYYGSLIHFMRSLATKTLEENNFAIFYKKLQVHPYKYFKIENKLDLTKVELTANRISILYNKTDQSSMETSNESTIFNIDELGNHSPPNSLIFGGDLGLNRISNLLPLDYSPNLN